MDAAWLERSLLMSWLFTPVDFELRYLSRMFYSQLLKIVRGNNIAAKTFLYLFITAIYNRAKENCNVLSRQLFKDVNLIARC